MWLLCTIRSYTYVHVLYMYHVCVYKCVCIYMYIHKAGPGAPGHWGHFAPPCQDRPLSGMSKTNPEGRSSDLLEMHICRMQIRPSATDFSHYSELP